MILLYVVFELLASGVTVIGCPIEAAVPSHVLVHALFVLARDKVIVETSRYVRLCLRQSPALWKGGTEWVVCGDTVVGLVLPKSIESTCELTSGLYNISRDVGSCVEGLARIDLK